MCWGNSSYPYTWGKLNFFKETINLGSSSIRVHCCLKWGRNSFIDLEVRCQKPFDKKQMNQLIWWNSQEISWILIMLWPSPKLDYWFHVVFSHLIQWVWSSCTRNPPQLKPPNFITINTCCSPIDFMGRSLFFYTLGDIEKYALI